MGKKYAIGVDLGGTKIAAASSDLNGNILQRVTEPTAPETGMSQGQSRAVAVIEKVKRTIQEVMDLAEVTAAEIAGIGLAVPGPLNPDAGIVYFAPNLPDWHDIPLKAIIEQAFGIPAFLDNDANLAGLGEFKFGAGRGTNNMVYMTVSTGIGGGIIVDKKIYRGSGFVAGEVGHMVLDPDGPLCGCGKHGCLEAMASGTAIARMAKEEVKAGAGTMMLDLAGGDPEKITARIVAQAAREGDRVAHGVIEKAATYLGLGIASIINLLNPEVIVIGGGVSKMGDMLFEPVRRVASARSLEASQRGVKIVPSQLGEDVGVVGALSLVFESAGVPVDTRS